MNPDSRVIQEISAIVDSMGFWDDQEKVYKINADTIECLKELLRLLRKDGSNFPVLRHLGSVNIVEKDLIPIIKSYCLTDEALAEYTIRLLVVLTYPALVFFKEKVPNEVDHKRTFLQINSFLRIYKVTFSQQKDFWEILCKKALIISKKDPIDQSEEDKILLERILILIRNVLVVPKDTCLDVADEDEMITEDLISSLKSSGALDLILQFTSDTISQQFCFHLLEIIYSLLRGQCPEFLAFDQSNSQHAPKRSRTCGNATESKELEELKERENRLRTLSKVSRFNRFKDSTYIIQNVKSIGEHDLIYHKTTENAHKISLDQDKTSNRRPKNRTIMTDNFTTRSSKSGIVFRRPSIKVQKILREFCEGFLKESYNSIMSYVKSALENRNAQDNDETYYFFTAYFFMEFNRVSVGDPSVIEETFNFEYFHFLHTKISTYSESIVTARSDREAVRAFSRRLHTAVKAYKELILTIASMKNVQEDRFLHLAKEMLDKVIIELDYRELILNLLIDYDESKMSPLFLRDLIETNHVFLKMFEHFTGENFNHVELTGRYCSGKVIRAYLLAFQRFDTNAEKLNHAIIRMFHRIACESKFHVLFFQLAVFRVFQKCFELNKIDKNKFVEVMNFARFIIREFVKMSKDNSKLLVELLFWKTKTEVRGIEEHYAPQEERPKNPRKPRKKGEKRRKKKDGFISESERSEESGTERDKINDIIDDDVAGLSDDSGEGFIPVLSSTQKTPSERQDEGPIDNFNGIDVTALPDVSDIPCPSIPDVSDIPCPSIPNVSDIPASTLPDLCELPDGSELPDEAELMASLDDDDSLDLDAVLDHVADETKENEIEDEDSNSVEDPFNQTVIERTVINSEDRTSDAEEEDVSMVRRKKKVILEESDDE